MRYLILLIFSLSLFSCTIGTEKEEYLNNETDTLFQIFTDSIILADAEKVNRSLVKFEQKISTPQTKYQEIMPELASLYSLKEKGEIDTAIAGFEKVVALLKLQEKPRFKRKLLDIDLTLGTTYLYEKNDMQKALPNFLEAKSLSEKYGNIYQKAEVNKYLGYVYFRQTNAIDARKSFEDALNVYYEIASTERPNHYVIQEQISNIGLSYYAQKNYDKAVEYFDSTISYINHKLKNFEDEDAKFVAKSIAEGNKARVLINLGKKKEAKKLLRKNYEQKKNHKRYKENATTEYFALTRLIIDQDLKLAESYLDTLSELVKEKPRKDVEQKLERLKAKYYERANPEKAIEIYKTQLAYKDSTDKALTQLNLRTKLDAASCIRIKPENCLGRKRIKNQKLVK